MKKHQRVVFPTLIFMFSVDFYENMKKRELAMEFNQKCLLSSLRILYFLSEGFPLSWDKENLTYFCYRGQDRSHFTWKGR